MLERATMLAGWGGLVLLSPVFLANALAIVDQGRAIGDLTGAGFSERFAKMNVGAGRVLQLVASAAIFYRPTRVHAAAALAGFLAVATVTAHPFWKAAGAERNAQLTNFLKNVAIMGGLLLAAGWRE